jgi:uncharacterized protein (TIGR01777 family)
MRIVMAGASGFLGTRLRRRLADDGHEILQLVRREPTSPHQRRWWPERHEMDQALLAGAGAVINLAGAGVEDKRWDERYKSVLRSSRVDPTTTLANALARLPTQQRPPLMVNASAVGFYGDTGDNPVTEESPPGHGFFPDLCEEWEGSTKPAEDAGVRVIKLRTGFPLHASGGLLKPLLLTFRLFVGGTIGNGRQWMPWMSLEDWLSAVTFLLAREDLSGAVNLVGPAPARYADFSRAIGRALHRPAILPIPRIALRVVLGEFANEAVASLRVLPGVLTRAGFTYRYPDLESALHAALNT